MVAHLYKPITDSQGNLRTNCSVALYAEGTTTPISAAFFSDEALTVPMTNPFDCPSGVIDVYFAAHERMDVGITPAGDVQVIVPAVDTAEPPGASVDPNANPVVIGSGASAGVDAVAVGLGAAAGGNTSVAVGSGATASITDAVAIGHGAQAEHAGSAALGAGATTTADNQVVLGTASDTVVVPGTLVASVSASPQSCMTVGLTGPTGFSPAGAVSVPLMDVNGDWTIKIPIVGWFPTSGAALTARFSPFPTLAGKTWVVFNGNLSLTLMDPLTGDNISAVNGGDLNITSGTAINATNWSAGETHGTTITITTAGLQRASAGPVVGWLTAVVERVT